MKYKGYRAKLDWDTQLNMYFGRLLNIKEEVVFEARPGRRVPLGISVGSAVFPQDGMSYESLLASADSRMYQDKTSRKGRDFRAATPKVIASSQFPELSENDIHRAAAGIL